MSDTTNLIAEALRGYARDRRAYVATLGARDPEHLRAAELARCDEREALATIIDAADRIVIDPPTEIVSVTINHDEAAARIGVWESAEEARAYADNHDGHVSVVTELVIVRAKS